MHEGKGGREDVTYLKVSTPQQDLRSQRLAIGNHAPAPCRGVSLYGGFYTARPVRPQDVQRRRVSATVTGPPPRSCAGNGTR